MPTPTPYGRSSGRASVPGSFTPREGDASDRGTLLPPSGYGGGGGSGSRGGDGSRGSGGRPGSSSRRGPRWSRIALVVEVVILLVGGIALGDGLLCFRKL